MEKFEKHCYRANIIPKISNLHLAFYVKKDDAGLGSSVRVQVYIKWSSQIVPASLNKDARSECRK